MTDSGPRHRDYLPMIRKAQIEAARVSGHSLELELEEVLYDYPGSASTVIRCRTSDADVFGKTVIVKKTNAEGDHFLHEWIALELLSGNEECRNLVPQKFAEDRESRLLLLEDIGNYRSDRLGEILESTDRERAILALQRFMESLGRLHAACRDEKERYDELVSRYGNPTVTRHKIHQITDCLGDLRSLPGEFDLRVPGGFETEIDEALQEISEPREFLTFTHGDYTPANAFLKSDRMMIIDFEACGFRHALLDGVFPRIRYLHSVWSREIPRSLQRELMNQYRHTLSRGCSAATEEKRFARAVSACAAGWLAGILRFLPAVQESDQRWGRMTNRQRIVAALNHFVILAEETGEFASIREFSERLERRLRKTWSEEECRITPYRAFGGEALV